MTEDNTSKRKSPPTPLSVYMSSAEQRRRITDNMDNVAAILGFHSRNAMLVAIMESHPRDFANAVSPLVVNHLDAQRGKISKKIKEINQKRRKSLKGKP